MCIHQGLCGSHTIYVSTQNTDIPRMWTYFWKNLAVQFIKCRWPRMVCGLAFRAPVVIGFPSLTSHQNPKWDQNLQSTPPVIPIHFVSWKYPRGSDVIGWYWIWLWWALFFYFKFIQRKFCFWSRLNNFDIGVRPVPHPHAFNMNGFLTSTCRCRVFHKKNTTFSGLNYPYNMSNTQSKVTQHHPIFFLTRWMNDCNGAGFERLPAR